MSIESGNRKVSCCSLSNTATGRNSKTSYSRPTSTAETCSFSLRSAGLFKIAKGKMQTNESSASPCGPVTIDLTTRKALDRSCTEAEILTSVGTAIQEVKTISNKKKFIMDLRSCSIHLDPKPASSSVERVPRTAVLASTGGGRRPAASEMNQYQHWSSDNYPSPNHARKLTLRLDPVIGDVPAVPSLQNVSGLEGRVQVETLRSLSIRQPTTKFTVGNFSTKHIVKPETNLSLTMRSFDKPPNCLRLAQGRSSACEEEDSSADN